MAHTDHAFSQHLPAFIYYCSERNNVFVLFFFGCTINPRIHFL